MQSRNLQTIIQIASAHIYIYKPMCKKYGIRRYKFKSKRYKYMVTGVEIQT